MKNSKQWQESFKKVKKFFSFLLFFSLFFLSTKNSLAVVNPENLQGDPLSDRQHFLWQIIGNLQSPDDSNCPSVAENALLAAGVPAGQVTEAKQNICASLTNIKSGIQNGMNSGNEKIETNLFSFDNWHQVKNLYFQHSSNGIVNGKIVFTQTIDFMSYDFMVFMTNFANKMDARKGFISLDADLVGGLAGYGAVLTMYNVPDMDDPVILVNDEEDTGEVVSGLVYDRANKIITFNAAHFSSFEAKDRKDLDKNPSIDKVKYRKYKKDGQWKLKVTLWGKNFNSKTKVYFGKTKAESVKKISSKKLTATFSWSDLQSQNSKSRLLIKVRNNSNEKVSSDNRKSLEKIKLKNN